MTGIAIITEACIDVKDRACVDVCPVQCIYEYDLTKGVLFSEDIWYVDQVEVRAGREVLEHVVAFARAPLW